MKIGIATVYTGYNYGSSLQALSPRLISGGALKMFKNRKK